LNRPALADRLFFACPLEAGLPRIAPNNAEGTEIQQPKRISMKYMISWWERPQGSPVEYENAQMRILEVFRQWKAPANFKIELFVIRVGDWGGYMMLDCDDPLEIHKFCSMLPAFEFEARPVIPVEDAVRVELEVMAWRDGLKKN
jgi:muconolactone delta-isomerase